MGRIIRLLAELINQGHDTLSLIFDILGIQISDKTLHFMVFGFFGILMFLVVDVIFKWISKWSITAISFIYTFTFLSIFALSVEIQQKITGRGNMEFDDILAGIVGFIVMFGVYIIIRLCIFYGKKLYAEHKGREVEH